MPALLKTILLLSIANLFMLFAWYGHLKNLSHKPLIIAILVSWGIALIEYCFQVPANRIGFSQLSLAQLKILQEVITLAMFVPFAVLYMQQPIKLDFLWAGLCLMARYILSLGNKSKLYVALINTSVLTSSKSLNHPLTNAQ